MPDSSTLRLAAGDSSARLRLALAAGTYPDPSLVEPLVHRLALEPDLNVRETLTWALARHPADLTIPLLLAEVRDGYPQARSQALHTLSKIGDPRGWAAITDEVLQDADAHVARTAWRTAALLVPAGSKTLLASTLATQLGRGDRDMRFSLSRALVALGEAADAVLAEAATDGGTGRSGVDGDDGAATGRLTPAAGSDLDIRIHAVATQRLALELDASFDESLYEAKTFVTNTNTNTNTSEPQ